MSGYLYRVFPADAARLLALAADLVGPPCWAFGGAALWEFEPAKGRENLRPITEIRDADGIAGLDVSGDFGHIFGETAELRWRRYGEASYDLLLLSEASLSIPGAEELAAGWATSEPAGYGVLQTDGRPTLRYVAYHAPSGAVQFLRYKGVL